MATIEERALHLAQEFGATKANKESAIYRACIRMATEQKAIDNKRYEDYLIQMNQEITNSLASQRKSVIEKARQCVKQAWAMRDSFANNDKDFVEYFMGLMKE